MTAALEEHQSSLVEVDGIGPVLGVRIIGRTGRPSRFRSADAFASYAGVAPIEVTSGERVTRRLSRSGDRQLNSALHLVAVTQVRTRTSVGRPFFDRKIAEGKTRNEAMRCLKRRLAAHVWRRCTPTNALDDQDRENRRSLLDSNTEAPRILGDSSLR
ncbi:transposase [Rhabdothermincola salaria]|uniref:transposase n=1 Tax=Rhabdothermincola salaria TaxID=2903142 RepID=UPI001E2F5731|nr:transposase [Rhabdothermincola salaria]MCD9624222.1 transposase [Rhabdothermincola salaria]